MIWLLADVLVYKNILVLSTVLAKGPEFVPQ
jgi:hypothetical protein